MTRSTRKTSSCPLTALFVALLFCTVADSYNTAATKYCITSRHTQSSSFDTIYSKKLNLNTRDSFSLRNSISQSHSCKRRSTFSSTVQLLVERARAWSGPRGIVMKTLFQKCAVICTMFLSTLLGRSQRVFAASAPLIKNVKVGLQLNSDACPSSIAKSFDARAVQCSSIIVLYFLCNPFQLYVSSIAMSSHDLFRI